MDKQSKNDPGALSAVTPNTPVDESALTTGGTSNNNDEFDPNTPLEVADQNRSSEPNPDDPAADDVDKMGKAVGMHSGGHAGKPSALNTAREVEKAEESR